MQHSEFSIGCEFTTAAGAWRCTDVGTPTIVAIRLEHDDDPFWYSGPPYPVVEHVFDEDGMEDCEPITGPRPHDNSGAANIVTVRR